MDEPAPLIRAALRATMAFLFVEVGEAESSLDASQRKARFTAGLFNRSGKEDQLMIHVLVKYAHAIFGRLTVLILWQRNRHR